MQGNKHRLWVLLSLILVAIHPLYFWFRDLGFSFDQVNLFTLFPLFGLLVFSIGYVQLVVGHFKNFFSRHINYDRFQLVSGIFVGIFFVLHPVLALVALGKFAPFELVAARYHLFLVFGMVAFLFYVAYEVLSRINVGWDKGDVMYVVGVVGFMFVFAHSIVLGSNLQFGALRVLWFIMGASGAGLIALGLKNLFVRRFS